METIPMVTVNGGKVELAAGAIQELRSRLRGPVLSPGEPGYDEARRIWNGTADRCPGLIVRCTGEADVIRAVELAARHDLLIAVRGGGHGVAGNSVCEGGLMIDLSLMRSVWIDPRARRALVGGGATLGDFDNEAQAFGLATPLGINSTTGVAGLTLGGGFGWLSRKHGLSVDNLRAADVVTAEGKLLRASAEENADLFWGIRGGGGNLGVVTRFDFQLHPLGPQIYAGLIVYPFDQAREVLERYRELVPRMPVELSVFTVLRKAPPLPFLGVEVHGKEVLILACFYADRTDDGAQIVDPLRRFGKPIGEHLGVMPYVAWQRALDPLMGPGARNYWKTHNLAELSDKAIETMLSFGGSLPSPDCEIILGSLGGKVNDVAPTATAYPHRRVRLVMNGHGRWQGRDRDSACISWTRELFQAMAPHAEGSAYVNFLTEEEGDRIREAYGPNYDRLVQLKAKYDPGNRFRLNQNIKPSPGVRR